MGIRIALLVVATFAFLTSLVFNLLQCKWRHEERARNERERDEANTEQRRKERVAPECYNANGTAAPIRISGSQYLMDGLVDLSGLITVVNPTQSHMKITPRRLVVNDDDWKCKRIVFHSRARPQKRSERISVMGNRKEDYELHFLFYKDKCPKGMSGELYLTSSNREEELFSIPIMFS